DRAPASGERGKVEARKVLLVLVLGTIPAGILGLIFRSGLTTLFADFRVAAVFLILNGLVLALGEVLRRRAGSTQMPLLKPWQAFAIGTSQAIALLPGFSRSGASMVGGVLCGVEDAADGEGVFFVGTCDL